MADLYQTETTNLFRSIGCWTDRHKDAYWDPKLKRWIYPETGFPDMRVFMSCAYRPKYPIALVEVKTGEGTNRERFAFSSWRQEQRDWYEKHGNFSLYYWLMIVMGKRIGGKKYGRLAILIPAEEFLQIEMQSARKSISYDQAAESEFRLTWDSGTGGWVIPENHLFYNTFLRERVA